jgi:hypothetical protein
LGAGGVDWIDPATGDTYDAVGNFPRQYFNFARFTKVIEEHLDKAKYIPVDVSTFSAEQRVAIREFVAGLGNPRVFIVGDH